MSAEPAVTALPVPRSRRVSPIGTVLRLSWHGWLAFFRNPLPAFFGVGFPLIFLVTAGFAQRGQPYADTNVSLTQFLVASFGALGIALAALCVLAVDGAALRDRGVLKRMRATPVSPASQLAARLLTATALCLLAFALLLAVGMAGFSVRPLGRMLPAMLVAILVGTCCFAALGLAIVAVVRTSMGVQAVTFGSIFPLAFISEIFLVGVPLPAALDWLGSAFPLKHLVLALRETFDPAATGAGFAPDHLAVLGAWTAAGLAIAGWGLSRRSWIEPAPSRRPVAAEPVAAAAPADGARLRRREPGRPSSWRLTSQLARHTIVAMMRDPLATFFVVAFPVLLLMLFPAVLDSAELDFPLDALLLTAMLTFAAGNTGYVMMAESAVIARARGVLKRWQAAPLPYLAFGASRFAAALAVVAICVALMLITAVVMLDVTFTAGGLALLAGVMVLGTVCFTAVGLAIVALMPNARSVIAVTLCTLMPLGFASEVFMLNANLPGWLVGLAEAFPLRHLAFALRAAIAPELDNGPLWVRLAALVGWTVLGLLLARPLFTRAALARFETPPPAPGGEGA